MLVGVDLVSVFSFIVRLVYVGWVVSGGWWGWVWCYGLVLWGLRFGCVGVWLCFVMVMFLWLRFYDDDEKVVVIGIFFLILVFGILMVLCSLLLVKVLCSLFFCLLGNEVCSMWLWIWKFLICFSILLVVILCIRMNIVELFGWIEWFRLCMKLLLMLILVK